MGIKHFILFSAVISIFAGCNKEKGSPVFRVTPETLTFEAAGGSQNLNVITTGNWKVSGYSHFSVGTSSGKGVGTVKVSAPEADSDIAVEEIITFSCGEKTATVKLTQKAKGAPVDAIAVTPSSLNFGAEKGSQDVTVTASGPWTVSSGEDWVTVTPAEVKAGIAVSENKSEERVATVTFTCGSATARLTIAQAKAAAPITQLSTAQDFLAFIDSFDKYAEGTVVEFLNDIDFKDVTISKYANLPATVTLDGKGFAVKNWANGGVPMFKINEGVIRNLVIDSSCTITYDGSAAQFGMFCTQNYNLIKGCINKADFDFSQVESNATAHWGMFVGINRNIIEDCVNEGKFTIGRLTGTGTIRFGVFAGSEADKSGTTKTLVVRNCTNKGNITVTRGDSKNSYIGGIVGYYDSTVDALVEGCENRGTITVSSIEGDLAICASGIAGYLSGGIITDCRNFGKISSTGSAGGIVGYLTKNKVESHNTMAGCAVNAEIIGNAEQTGLVFGICSKDLLYTFGADAPIKVAGTVNGTAVTGDNFPTLLCGSASAPATESKINAKFEAVTPKK